MSNKSLGLLALILLVIKSSKESTFHLRKVLPFTSQISLSVKASANDLFTEKLVINSKSKSNGENFIESGALIDQLNSPLFASSN